MSHPNFQQLSDYQSGLLDQQACGEIAQHVASCEPCGQLLASSSERTSGTGGRMTEVISKEFTPGDEAAAADDTVAQQLQNHPRYEIIGPLGKGGMGSVFKARHRLMNRIVAVKVILPQFLSHPAAVKRFHREVRIAARLSHRNIVAAYDAERFSGLHLLIMEFVDGVPADQLVRPHLPLKATEACELVRQVALGLQHAHEHNTVHRDIKPHNLIVLRDRTLKILDFGLARFASDQCPSHMSAFAAGITSPNDVLGTPDYMAPEQITDSSTADIRADIYSLGCTLFYFLSGQPPFPGGSAIEKLCDHVSSKPPALTDVCDQIPPQLSTLVEKMLAKDPADRFRTPAELIPALQPFTPTTSQAALTQSATVTDNCDAPSVKEQTFPVALQPVRRRVWMMAGTLTMLVVGGGILGLPWLHSDWQSSGKEQLPFAGPAENVKPILFVVPADGLWWDDYAPVRAELESQGIDVVATAEQPHVRGIGDFSGERSMHAEVLLNDVIVDQFDGLVIAGGVMDEFTDDGPTARRVNQLVQQMLDEGKIVAAICVGQMVLAEGGFLQGRQAARNNMVASHYPDAARWVHAPVVSSGQIITADEPERAISFAQAIVSALGDSPH